MNNKKVKKDVMWNGVPFNDPVKLKAINDAVSCTFEPYHKIEQAKDEIKDIFDAIHDETGIPRRVFNFLAKNNFTGKGYEVVSKNGELADALEAMQQIHDSKNSD